MYADDTIAAVATAPGHGGVGIVRISGPLATLLAPTLFRRTRTTAGDWETHRLYGGDVLDAEGQPLDRGLAVIMRKPGSYTGEDILELHCHGSPVVLRAVVAAALAHGARLAEPGEFTKRAFLNGRLDLPQAEAVIDLVRARTTQGAALAAQQLCGSLSTALDTVRVDIVGLKALLEVQIDFSEDDVAVDPQTLIATTECCVTELRRLIATYQHGRLVREGAQVAIVGRPNVGKSSLLNALLGEDRAIVSPLAGTTRDTIDEAINLFGVPVVLTDTAGLREDDATDPVELLGMQRTAAKIAAADLVLAVYDLATPPNGADRAVATAVRRLPHLVVLNKTDLPAVWGGDDIVAMTNGRAVLRVSATHHLGLDPLRRAMREALDALPVDGTTAPVLTNERQRNALAKALDSLELARRSILDRQPPELVSVDVQDAIDRIGEVTGAVTSEDVLDRIFQEFCIGK
jgi:tRNA modification GTPase